MLLGIPMTIRSEIVGIDQLLLRAVDDGCDGNMKEYSYLDHIIRYHRYIFTDKLLSKTNVTGMTPCILRNTDKVG